jgi:hypothetical protein
MSAQETVKYLKIKRTWLTDLTPNSFILNEFHIFSKSLPILWNQQQNADSTESANWLLIP